MRLRRWTAAGIVCALAAVSGHGCASPRNASRVPADTPAAATRLVAERNEAAGTIVVKRSGSSTPIVTQHARPDHRPYLHPIAAPDGKGVLTEANPGHHPHQTGLYWGFTRLNGRDYFHNPGADYWRRVSLDVLEAQGEIVRWQTVYELLGESGQPVLTETQRWSMRESEGRFLLDLEWRGQARTGVTVSQYDYGGLFLRMPWREGIQGEVINAARQRNERGEGQRAMWVDVGMKVDGRDDLAHVAIFDHPDNVGYPQPWRVDGELGVGPARSRTGDWSIADGETEVIRHRLVAYTGTLDDVKLTDAWMDYTGVRSTSVLWAIAQREGLEAEFLTPERAVAAMTSAPGFVTNVWAAEPMITQPMAFTWDDRGRLWIAENRDYESRGRGFSNAGDSRILILEDTNRDGAADKRTVFMEGLAFPAALAVGFGGVYVGAPPNLLFIPDRDGDDKADVDNIEVLLTGWGIRDRHETLNSLHWGPDGWLYGLQGFATTSKVRRPEGRGRIYRRNDPFPEDLLTGDGVEINGGVWRIHPTRHEFEVVAHGFSNPWGIDHDAKGQLLMSACVIPHLWHVVPGGIYHRQGGQHFNPYVYSDITTIADHRHRSAHGGARIYQSDAFPPEYQGRIFMANIHEHAVLSDVLERAGSGFVGRHGDDFLMANNAQFVGFSLEIGPDGALYVLDWHDADICGQEVLHKETGRIFRVAPQKSLAESFEGRYADLRALSDTQLVDLLTKRSAWHARRAQLTLQHRAMSGRLDPGTHARLRAMFGNRTNADWRLRAMWALHVTGGWTAESLLQTLGDQDEYIRAWAVQLLTEGRAPSQAALTKFAQMAREDASAVVRLYLASALQRIDRASRWAIAEPLLAHGEDSDDHNLPKMIWLAVEPLVPADPAAALDRTGRGAIPLVARFAARRAFDANQMEAVVAAIGRGPKLQVNLLEGLRDGLEGRSGVQAPAAWAAIFGRLQRAGGTIAGVAREIDQQFGDTASAGRSLALALNSRAPLEDRRLAVRRLAAERRPELAPRIPTLFNDNAVRIDVIRAMASYDNEAFGTLLLGRYATLPDAEKVEAIQTLASRPVYGRLLTRAIATGAVPRRDVPRHIARQLLRVVGSGFVEVWGPVEESANDARAWTRYRRLLTDAAVRAANARNGRTVFDRTCGSCHKLYGEGGQIGPDLTGSNRANLDYLLFNVLDPSGEVQDDYRMVVVTTRDGRTYAGNVVSETDRQVTMRVVGQEAVRINVADIQSREVTSVSMMPPGMFDALTETELLDLVAYLRTTEQTTR